MVQQADALVVSDDPVVVATIAAATSALGLRSRGTVSATEAEAMLRMRSPTLAVIHSGCAGELVLGELARAHPTTHTVLVVDRPEGEAAIDGRVIVAHPYAVVLRGSRPERCAGELSMLLERQVGDVRLERGSVVHLPSGTRFRHEIGVRMLLAYPSDLCFKRRTTGYTALYRFRKWLSRVGASVRVQPAGGATSFYRLECVDSQATLGSRDRRTSQERGGDEPPISATSG